MRSFVSTPSVLAHTADMAATPPASTNVFVREPASAALAPTHYHPASSSSNVVSLSFGYSASLTPTTNLVGALNTVSSTPQSALLCGSKNFGAADPTSTAAASKEGDIRVIVVPDPSGATPPHNRIILEESEIPRSPCTPRPRRSTQSRLESCSNSREEDGKEEEAADVRKTKEDDSGHTSRHCLVMETCPSVADQERQLPPPPLTDLSLPIPPGPSNKERAQKRVKSKQQQHDTNSGAAEAQQLGGTNEAKTSATSAADNTATVPAKNNVVLGDSSPRSLQSVNYLANTPAIDTNEQLHGAAKKDSNNISNTSTNEQPQIQQQHHQQQQPSSAKEKEEGILLAERFRTHLCRNLKKREGCQFGIWCMFAHSDIDRRTLEMNIQDGLTTMTSIDAYREAQYAAALAAAKAQGGERGAALTASLLMSASRRPQGLVSAATALASAAAATNNNNNTNNKPPMMVMPPMMQAVNGMVSFPTKMNIMHANQHTNANNNNQNSHLVACGLDGRGGGGLFNMNTLSNAPTPSAAGTYSPHNNNNNHHGGMVPFLRGPALHQQQSFHNGGLGLVVNATNSFPYYAHNNSNTNVLLGQNSHHVPNNSGGVCMDAFGFGAVQQHPFNANTNNNAQHPISSNDVRGSAEYFSNTNTINTNNNNNNVAPQFANNQMMGANNNNSSFYSNYNSAGVNNSTFNAANNNNGIFQSSATNHHGNSITAGQPFFLNGGGVGGRNQSMSATMAHSNNNNSSSMPIAPSQQQQQQLHQHQQMMAAGGRAQEVANGASVQHQSTLPLDQHQQQIQHQQHSISSSHTHSSSPTQQKIVIGASQHQHLATPSSSNVHYFSSNNNTNNNNNNGGVVGQSINNTNRSGMPMPMAAGAPLILTTAHTNGTELGAASALPLQLANANSSKFSFFSPQQPVGSMMNPQQQHYPTLSNNNINTNINNNNNSVPGNVYALQHHQQQHHQQQQGGTFSFHQPHAALIPQLLPQQQESRSQANELAPNNATYNINNSNYYNYNNSLQNQAGAAFGVGFVRAEPMAQHVHNHLSSSGPALSPPPPAASFAAEQYHRLILQQQQYGGGSGPIFGPN